MNTLVVGMTQSGKSTAELVRLSRLKGAVVVLDPHNNLAVKYMEYLACRKSMRNVVYDDLARTDKVLHWPFLEPSQRTGIEGAKENDGRGRAFADILCRRRGLDISKTPLIEEWAIAAIKLWMYQRKPRPLPDIVYAFKPRHPKFMKLVEHCERREIANKFHDLFRSSRVSPIRVRGEVGAAERLFEATLHAPGFMIRCDGGFDYKAILDADGKIIIGGDRENRNATRVVMSAIIQLVIGYVRRGGKPVRIVVDEANNYELIGQPELDSLAEDSKAGLSWDILVQSLDFDSAMITDRVLTNCDRHEWFRCSSESAKQAAFDVGVPTADPYKVHHVDKKTKQLHDGYDWAEKRSTSTQTGKSTSDPNLVELFENRRTQSRTGFTSGTSEQALGRFRTIEEETVHYENLKDQILLRQQKIMTQNVGQRTVRIGGRVFTEQVEPVEAHPWPRVAAKRGAEAIEASIGKYGTKPYLPSSKSTPPQQGKSSGSVGSGKPNSGATTKKENSGAATSLFGEDLTD